MIPSHPLDAVMSQAQLKRRSKTISEITNIRGSLAAADYCRWNYKLRWIVWRSTPGNRRYCASFLRRWGTIRLSSLNALPGPLLAERLLTQSASEQVKQINITA